MTYVIWLLLLMSGVILGLLLGSTLQGWWQLAPPVLGVLTVVIAWVLLKFDLE